MPQDTFKKPATIDPATDRRWPFAFPILSDEHLAALESFGNRLRIKKDQDVWQAGTANMCMFVVIEGEMAVVDGRARTFIASHTKGGFSGDIDILTGRPSVVSAIAVTDMELLEVPGDCVRHIVGERPDLGEILLKAFLLRRAMLQEKGDVGVLVIGSRYNADTLKIREFLTRNRFPVDYEDIETSGDAARLLEEFQVSENDTPVVVLPNGSILKSPSVAQLASLLGILRPVEEKLYDVVIVGAGPAGLAAGVYGASEGLSTLVLDSNAPGGQAGTSSKIENYMGFPLGVSGQELADGAVAQAEKFGAQMLAPASAVSMKCGGRGTHTIEVEGVGQIETRCVVLASGAAYRRLEVDDLDRFEGCGVYYAATNVERILCREAQVAVVGAGNSAGQAAVYMCESSSQVFLVVRGDDLRKSMSSYLARRIEGLAQAGRLTLMLNSEICQLQGKATLERVVIRDRSNGAVRDEAIEGVFVMIGAVPRTDWMPDKIARDSKGFVLTGQQVVDQGLWSQGRAPFFLETACPGVFAVGDARSNSIKRVASAVGEGSMAIAFIHQFLAL